MGGVSEVGDRPLGLRQTTVSYLLALGMIASLSVGTHVLVDSIVREQESSARIVNIAGRQRMLSQRIADLSVELSSEFSSAERDRLLADLADAIALMERSHHALRHGDPAWQVPSADSPAARAIYEDPPYRLESRVQAFLDRARVYRGAMVYDTLDVAALADIRAAARRPLLEGLDAAVRTYQEDSERAIRDLRTVLFVILSLMLGTLAAEAWLIFRPLFKRLADRERKLVDLAADLDQALTLSTSELRLSANIIEHTGEAVVVAARDGSILSVNPAFCEITGYARAEVLGQPLAQLRSDRAEEADFDEVWQGTRKYGVWRGERWMRSKRGEDFYAHLTVNALPPDLSDSGAALVAVFNDITEIRRKDETIAHMAFHDVLTGLPNRDLLRDRLDRLIQQGRASGGVHAVMSADLNRFKTVNENLGQTFGDAVLCQAAERLRRLVAETDTVARVGGDEFVALLSGREGAGDYAILADSMVAALSRPYLVGGKELRLTASAGVALFPADGESGADLQRRADGARRVAKRRGGGYQFYQPDIDQAVRRRLRLEVALGEAADKNAFTLEFQPKVRLRDGEVDGVEALLRWRSDEFGAISPAMFIPMAEETGAITRIGEWVLQESCRQAGRFRETGLPLSVAANISAKQMLAGDLPRRIAALLDETGLDPELLQLELTESSVILNQESTIAQLAALREMGVRTALDDFGTGYSSLSYLRHLPIDYLKIDRSFVMQLETDDTDVTVVRGIVAMGHALGLKVIAEGIESEGQVRILRESGCDLGQGFLFSQPLPPQRLTLWMGARRADRQIRAAQG